MSTFAAILYLVKKKVILERGLERAHPSVDDWIEKVKKKVILERGLELDNKKVVKVVQLVC